MYEGDQLGAKEPLILNPNPSTLAGMTPKGNINACVSWRNICVIKETNCFQSQITQLLLLLHLKLLICKPITGTRKRKLRPGSHKNIGRCPSEAELS